ncbi:hypothetical protein ACJJI3_03535 [Microbulbifer sp. ZKSA004]|uniref:hypothetical protein n=1 Tax=Microbulbifer sp. ZKSA004 TaxID=3243389 RepID=UPI00403A29B5
MKLTDLIFPRREIILLIRAALVRMLLSGSNLLGVEVKDIYQEDWGWEMSCSFQGNNYYVGFGGLPSEEGQNNGEWRVIVTKSRSIIQMLSGKNKLLANEPMMGVLSSIIEKAGFSNVSDISA